MPTATDKTVTTVTGPAVPVRGNDIDTDQIVPARFLKEVTFDNMGEYAFYDVRRDDDGTLNDHPFNRYPNANILVVNENFGCGSSREHAPQALMRWGIDGLIGESFAEIFAGNCQALGLPTATADRETVEWIMAQVTADPALELTIDVEEETVTVGDEPVDVTISDAQREALLQGIWDTTALMKSYMDEVEATADRLPYLNEFANC
ncbi:3-isopropylmalate dehydratase small subunit [Salinibacter ruber]|uniref:3-isopropylmalate dehydratase small subunit n=1 Tax=Salinibacter ruber TaxID=146919 RepID=UPI00216928A3|nr:3-isopropylmalate dehydratase small subunit [Salinibacter ruber]MCS3757152.1 3-isopropylmalate/(R)-2-methylmalate dehydratase small subunit [Salinibacter ruber]MCS3862347.1 3-isopropylmalate/(R)-2-methylmalate dehydratase small subunit [Salinibacter ruber]